MIPLSPNGLPDGSGDQVIRGTGRRRLLDAAATVYMSDGPRLCSVRRVCAAAGVSTGTLFHHFPAGVRDLQAATYLTARSEYQGGILSALARRGPAKHAVMAAVRFQFEWVQANTAVAFYLDFFNSKWLLDRYLSELTDMDRVYASAVADWRQRCGNALLPVTLHDLLYMSLLLAPARLYALERARACPSNLADHLRRAAPQFEQAAWRAVASAEA
ncbi:MAG TPA: TetR/AcrR family transcriptional regulator [Acidimicrobiales bacterium]|nr:TetR/AcrR family transcriptional regulator [Acidimicrobiales bacterium]